GFTGGQNDSEAFFNLSGLADPGTLYRFIPRTGRVSRFFRPELPFDPDDFITTHTTYPSKDGTRVPIFIAHKRGVKPGGQTPLFLYGYGAFGWSAFPWYQPQIVAWMEMGG
ncbi:MAG: S9 family peptidase, partial [Pseudomonadales bacterium]|nr:S9 family peptidase [Pseudomonadales bacterium]NIX07337.1 S9 family peptidase [Pseudomonadales bacterium]